MRADLIHRHANRPGKQWGSAPTPDAPGCSSASQAMNGVAIRSMIDDAAPRRSVNALDHSTNRASPTDWSKRYLAGGFWVLLGRVLGVATTLLSNVVLARLMAPADFGNFLLVVSVIGVGMRVAMFGINHVMVRLVGESLGMADADRARRALRLGATVATTSIFTVGLAAPFVLYFVLPQANLSVTVLVSISIAIMLIAWQQIAGESLRRTARAAICESAFRRANQWPPDGDSVDRVCSRLCRDSAAGVFACHVALGRFLGDHGRVFDVLPKVHRCGPAEWFDAWAAGVESTAETSGRDPARHRVNGHAGAGVRHDAV